MREVGGTEPGSLKLGVKQMLGWSYNPWKKASSSRRRNGSAGDSAGGWPGVCAPSPTSLLLYKSQEICLGPRFFNYEARRLDLGHAAPVTSKAACWRWRGQGKKPTKQTNLVTAMWEARCSFLFPENVKYQCGMKY